MATHQDRFLGLSITPLTHRRFRNFRANQRGYWSLWIFLIIFVVTIPAEFIANDKPLLVKFEGAYFYPVFFEYPETAFGGDFETETEYRDEFVQELINENGLDPMAVDSLQLPHHQLRSTDTGTIGARCRKLARHRRPGPRRHRAHDLRVSNIGAVRPGVDLFQLHRRGRRGRRTGLFSVAGPTCCSSASSKSGRACPPCSC